MASCSACSTLIVHALQATRCPIQKKGQIHRYADQGDSSPQGGIRWEQFFAKEVWEEYICKCQHHPLIKTILIIIPILKSLFPHSLYLLTRLSESPDLIALGQWAGKIPGKPDLPDDTHLGQVTNHPGWRLWSIFLQVLALGSRSSTEVRWFVTKSDQVRFLLKGFENNKR